MALCTQTWRKLRGSRASCPDAHTHHPLLLLSFQGPAWMRMRFGTGGVRLWFKSALRKPKRQFCVRDCLGSSGASCDLCRAQPGGVGVPMAKSSPYLLTSILCKYPTWWRTQPQCPGPLGTCIFLVQNYVLYRNHSHMKDVPYFIQCLIHTSVVLNLVSVYRLSSYPVSGLPIENWGWGWARMLQNTSCDADLRLHPKGAHPALRGPCGHTVPCPKARTLAVVW